MAPGPTKMTLSGLIVVQEGDGFETRFPIWTPDCSDWDKINLVPHIRTDGDFNIGVMDQLGDQKICGQGVPQWPNVQINH